MGSDKALLLSDGRTQLARTVALLERHLDRVFVSVRADQASEEERSKYPQIVDRLEEFGPMAGILSALQTHRNVAWLVVACDLPNVDDRTIEHLLEQRQTGADFTAYKSSYDQLPEPLCAIYPADSLAIVESRVAEGLKCPRKMLIQSNTRLLAPLNAAALDNVNTPDDLALAANRRA